MSAVILVMSGYRRKTVSEELSPFQLSYGVPPRLTDGGMISLSLDTGSTECSTSVLLAVKSSRAQRANWHSSGR